MLSTYESAICNLQFQFAIVTMDLTTLLPTLLGMAWLLPLASFVLIVFFGKRMGHGGKAAGYLATAAIVGGFVLSLAALICWLSVHPLAARTPSPRSRLRRLVHARPVRLAVADHRLLHRLADHRHVLHGHAHRLVHPRLLAGLHARRAARSDRSAGPIGKRRAAPSAAADSIASSSTCRSSASACWAW